MPVVRMECLWPEMARNGDLEKTLEKRKYHLSERRETSISISINFPARQLINQLFHIIWVSKEGTGESLLCKHVSSLALI